MGEMTHQWLNGDPKRERGRGLENVSLKFSDGPLDEAPFMFTLTRSDGDYQELHLSLSEVATMFKFCLTLNLGLIPSASKQSLADVSDEELVSSLRYILTEWAKNP